MPALTMLPRMASKSSSVAWKPSTFGVKVDGMTLPPDRPSSTTSMKRTFGVNSERERASSVESRLITSLVTFSRVFMNSWSNMSPSRAITATRTRLAPPKSSSYSRKVFMYSCSSGICFLKPASTCSCEAKYSIAAVTAANSTRIRGRLPKTSFSARRANGPGWALGRLMLSPSLRAVQAGALVADQDVAVLPIRQHGDQRGRLAGLVLVTMLDERRVAVLADQHQAVAAHQHGAAVRQRGTADQAGGGAGVDGGPGITQVVRLQHVAAQAEGQQVPLAPGQDAEHRALVGQALLLPGLAAVGGAEEGAALAHHHQRTVVGAGDGVEVRIGLGVQLEVGGVEGPAVLVGLDDLLLRLVPARLDDGARLPADAAVMGDQHQRVGADRVAVHAVDEQQVEDGHALAGIEGVLGPGRGTAAGPGLAAVGGMDDDAVVAGSPQDAVVGSDGGQGGSGRDAQLAPGLAVLGGQHVAALARGEEAGRGAHDIQQQRTGCARHLLCIEDGRVVGGDRLAALVHAGLLAV